jgi:hypothetical protein
MWNLFFGDDEKSSSSSEESIVQKDKPVIIMEDVAGGSRGREEVFKISSLTSNQALSHPSTGM